MPSSTSSSGRKTKRGRGVIAGLLGVALVVIVGVGALFTTRVLSAGDGDASSRVDLHRVASETFEITVSASGELEAENQTEIRSELESTADIVEIVDEGVTVTRGDILVRLNDEAIRRSIEDQMLNVEAARNDLIAAENSLAIQINENEAALRQAQLKVELAELDLEKWREGEIRKRLLQLETNLEKAERDYERLIERLERSEELFSRSFLSKDDLEQDRIRALEAEAAVETAKTELWLYENYEHKRDEKQKVSDVEEAMAELERVKRLNESRRASREADVTNRRRSLGIREERLAKLEEQLEACTIRAPTDGLVVYGTSIGNSRGFSMVSGDGPLQIGRSVRPNELLIVLPDTTSMVASVRVHESVAGRIRPGQPATVRVDALRGQSFTGRVKSVSVLAESGGWRDPNLREYTVKVLLQGGNPDQKLKPSMRADSEIVLGEVEDSLAVPVQAVFHEGRISYVYTSRGGKYAKTPVRLGRRSTTMAEVAAGIEPGQQVLLREPSPGEVLNREFDPAAVAAIMPPAQEREQGRRTVQQADEPEASTASVDVEAIRNNPDLPQSVRDRMKNMSDEQIRQAAQRFRQGGRASGPAGATNGATQPSGDGE